ncbi:MAG: outer membrane lipoprotein carrier protein LolA [Acidobacteriia bacterium]|nr:outer membrane lipoprotein carrier protein LolA [Terriglobia bacterium]
MLLLVAAGSFRDGESIRRALEARYQHARTLKAVFFERYSDGHGGAIAESGTVYFSRPGRMRWEYESPEPKLFLVDGSNAWFYVPADRTASRAKMKESSDWRTPLALLAGKADLSKLCRSLTVVAPGLSVAAARSAEPLSPGNAVLRCAPRLDQDESGGVKEVLFEVDSEARLVRVVIREAGNAETEFRFSNWQEDITIPEAKFHIQLPPGVAIVDEESLAGQMR